MKMKPIHKRWILLSILFVLVIVSIYLVLDFSGVIMHRTVDVDTLYSGYHIELALPGPEFEAEEAYQEIDLDDEFVKSTTLDCSLASEDEKLAIINKWAAELYPCFGSFMLASVMDSLTYETGNGILKNSTSTQKTANSIGLWSKNRLQQTQHFAFFQRFPGKDPWGSLNPLEPVYKKTLPCEMLAKSAYTGKITGKCCSLAALNTGVFIVAGADPEDTVILRYGSHEVGIIRYDGMLYITNNELVYPIDDKVKEFLFKQKYTGFFNYSLSVVQNFNLNEAFFSADGSLLMNIAALTGNGLPKEQLLTADSLRNRESLHARVFGNAGGEEQKRLFTLARYAYQSLYVEEPTLYLKASARAPIVKELAKKLKTEEGIVNWIESNISNSPIFDDYAQRLMIADQVIVFKKGGPKDQAVLAYALLQLNDISSMILITKKTAYLEVNNKVYDAKTWNVVDAPDGETLLELQ